jgi:hypothetical protein
MSITITLSPAQIEECTKLAKEIHSSKQWGWNWENVLLGTVGEMAYGIYTNQKLNKTIYESVGDGGTDFPDGAQVKTVTWSGPSKEVKVSQTNKPLRNPPSKYVLAHATLRDITNVTLIGEISLTSFEAKKETKAYRGKQVYIVTEYNLDKLY